MWREVDDILSAEEGKNLFTLFLLAYQLIFSFSFLVYLFMYNFLKPHLF